MITKQQFAATMDHSCLGNYTSKKDVEKFCREVLEYGFAAVYVNPSDVKLAKSLIGNKAGVGTVIGFPQGVATTESKIFEGKDAIGKGANELDVVINVSKLKDGETNYCLDELSQFTSAMKKELPSVIVKVIIECYHLTHLEKITACKIVADAGADYVKQSTGTTPNSSFCLGDIKLFNAVIGDRIKIKSAGWIINLEDAIGSIEFGASRVGNSLGPLWLSEWDQNHWYDQLKKI